MSSINNTLKERGNKYGKFKHNADVTQKLLDIIQTVPGYSKLSNIRSRFIRKITFL